MMQLEDVKQQYLAVDFYLTKSCNKSCHYCTAWTKEMRNLTVDLEFLRNTLELFKPYKTRINLLGGEPGLVKNLREVIDMIQEYDNFIVEVLSNSVVRKRYPWVLEDPSIIYVEHLVLDFYEDRIEKLGRFDFLPPNDNNNYNLIIMTPNYMKYKHKYNLISLNHENTIFKEYNSRSPDYVAEKQEPELKRRICAAFPMVPVIDFEERLIRHCSKKVINGSRRFEITKENIDKMMNFELFEYEDYCKKCMEPIADRPQEQILQILEVGNV